MLFYKKINKVIKMKCGNHLDLKIDYTLNINLIHE
jgi:hypothetical protein